MVTCYVTARLGTCYGARNLFALQRTKPRRTTWHANVLKFTYEIAKHFSTCGRFGEDCCRMKFRWHADKFPQPWFSLSLSHWRIHLSSHRARMCFIYNLIISLLLLLFLSFRSQPSFLLRDINHPNGICLLTSQFSHIIGIGIGGPGLFLSLLPFALNGF